MNYFLINDTRSEFHWGCWGVSTSILDLLENQGNVVGCISTEQLKKEPIQKLISKIRRFQKSEPIRVIVNGEGSLHSGNLEGKKIVKLLKWFATQNSASTYEIWNASIYELDEEFEEFYRNAHRIVVRDNYSLHMINHLTQVEVCPDLLFWWLLKNNFKTSHVNGVTISDSVNRKHLENYALVKSFIDVKMPGASISFLDIRWDIFDLLKKTLSGAFEFKCISLIDLARLTFRSVKFRVKRVKKYQLTTADVNFSGRYHLAVILLYSGESFYILPSNSPKIINLAKLLANDENGIDITISKSDKNLINVCVNEYDKLRFFNYVEKRVWATYGMRFDK